MAEHLDRSRAQEARLAGRVGGVVVPRSGAGWKMKGDVRSATVLYEMKRTNRRTITIKADDLDTLRRHAYQTGREPVLGFELGGRNYVVVPEDDWLELRGEG